MIKMIKLEDLKIGDKVYGVSKEGNDVYAETIVLRELDMIDNYPNPIEGVWCNGGIEIIIRSWEDYIFRTQKEANEKLEEIRLDLAEQLLKSDNFMDRLFECATSSKRLSNYSEVPIYRIAIDLYKQRL
jgi:hypothetical protein